MKSIRIYLSILSILLISLTCFAQTKRAKIGEITFHKISEFYGQVINEKISTFGEAPFLNLSQVQIDVKENGTNPIQSLYTDVNGNFKLELEYDKYYIVNFSKQGYYSRSIRIYTYLVPDTLKEIKFGNFRKSFFDFSIELYEVVSNEYQNPFQDDFAIYSYKPVEIVRKFEDENYLVSFGFRNILNKDSLYIKGGGIVRDLNYLKSINASEQRIKSKLLAEYGNKTKKKLTDVELKIAIQQLENDKIKQEKLLLLKNKQLNEAEIKEQKIKAQSKQKELELANQEKRTKQLEIENANYTKNAFLGLAVFIAIVGLLLLRAYFIKRNSNTKLHKQNELIAEQKQEITDSIQYAQRIQFAILPTKENITKAFPQSFILFKPKDIVSGDFYWFQEVDGKKYIAACDCTGHGVPGALMSMVATDMLNEALVHTKKVDEILALTNRSIRVALKQSNDDESTRDGMDIALCCFDDKTNVVQFAGAYRPLWLIRFCPAEQNEAPKNGSQLMEYKATKAAIGGLTEDDQTFQLNEIQLQKGDTIYLSSDGYADQFSPSDKKLMTKRFKEILLSIQHLSMSEQEKYLAKFITDWQGNMEQTDDVLVIGVRV
jgi:serine phosphatase RsbU (regulator of sigma subunit)